MQTIGTGRFVYNLFVATQKEIYAKGEKYQNAISFSKWMNNQYLKEHPDMAWIKDVSTKSVLWNIQNADRAFQRFFRKQSGFPCFKKKGKSCNNMYFVRESKKKKILCERHKIKIPTIGWIKIKEKGYIPTNKSGLVIKSGVISEKAGRYYVSVLVEIAQEEVVKSNNPGIGIDLGIKNLATCSSYQTFENINKTQEVKRLEKKLKREQRSLSRMIENLKKGKTTQKNLQKQKKKIQRIHQRLDNIRTDHINKIIAEIVKTKPSYVTIEDLFISGMMKNRHLSKAISQQKLYEFRTKLTNKCHQKSIELRVADRWYPSSKICNCCGVIKKDLRLSERTYICACGYMADRDYNASLNLRDCRQYKLA